MNERITELRRKSWDSQTDSVDTEKLAKLILEDVMSICEDLGDKGMDGHYCVDAIRNKFGLKDKNTWVGLTDEEMNEMQQEERDAELRAYVKEFFERYLNLVEESDNGKEFNPITVSCCRALMLEPLNNLLNRMAELSGAERKNT